MLCAIIEKPLQQIFTWTLSFIIIYESYWYFHMGLFSLLDKYENNKEV